VSILLGDSGLRCRKFEVAWFKSISFDCLFIMESTHLCDAKD